LESARAYGRHGFILGFGKGLLCIYSMPCFLLRILQNPSSIYFYNAGARVPNQTHVNPKQDLSRGVCKQRERTRKVRSKSKTMVFRNKGNFREEPRGGRICLP
jgi:hypothetical protein